MKIKLKLPCLIVDILVYVSRVELFKRIQLAVCCSFPINPYILRVHEQRKSQHMVEWSYGEEGLKPASATHANTEHHRQKKTATSFRPLKSSDLHLSAIVFVFTTIGKPLNDHRRNDIYVHYTISNNLCTGRVGSQPKMKNNSNNLLSFSKIHQTNFSDIFHTLYINTFNFPS